MNELILKLSKPYTFEGVEYTEIDLAKLEDMTVEDLEKFDKMFAVNGQPDPLKEMSISYACIVAAHASQKPIEFFKKLPLKDGMKLKLMVQFHFFG